MSSWWSRFSRISVVPLGPVAVEVRNESFRWTQTLAYIIWIPLTIGWIVTVHGVSEKVVSAVLLVASVFMLWRTQFAGRVRVDVNGVVIGETARTRRLDRDDVRWFAVQSIGPGREHLSVRLQGDESLLVRSVYRRLRRKDSGPSEVRAAADALNQVLFDLRADGPQIDRPT